MASRNIASKLFPKVGKFELKLKSYLKGLGVPPPPRPPTNGHNIDSGITQEQAERVLISGLYKDLLTPLLTDRINFMRKLIQVETIIQMLF